MYHVDVIYVASGLWPVFPVLPVSRGTFIQMLLTLPLFSIYQKPQDSPFWNVGGEGT